jgi:hypothetical protein
MASEQELEVLRKFADIAALAGIKGEIDEELSVFRAGFELSEGRSQMVYVRPLPEAIAGKDAICVVSPCRRVKKGFFSGLKKDEGLELLRLNSEVLMARYALEDTDDGYMVVTSIDCILETLDPEELEAYVWSLAIAADNYEKRFGGDEF